MTVTRVVPILRVTDMPAALAFYQERLGFTTDFTFSLTPSGPTYAGLSLDGHQVHLSTFGGDSARGAAVYFYVADVDALFQGFLARGLTTPRRAESPVEDGPVDQTWGMREVYVRDPDGNTLRFGTPLARSD